VDQTNEQELLAPAQSGLDPTLPLAALTDQERADLCEWTALAAPGGSTVCGNGSTMIEAGWTAQTCQNELSSLRASCEASVADHERCVKSSACNAEKRQLVCSPTAACQLNEN